MMRPHLASLPKVLVPAVLSSLAFASPGPIGDAADELSSRASALLAEGKPAEALAAVQNALEYEPENPALLILAAQASQALEQKDDAHWYATLGMDVAAGAKEHRDAEKQLTVLLAELKPGESSAEELLEDYAESLFSLAQICQRKKLYANAVEFLARCRGTRFERRANEQLDKLFNNKKAIAALLESGIDIPAKPVTKKKPEWIAREDKKHAEWENAYEIKTDYYTVHTNMGYEMAQSISLAMEQMNGFYRKVFQYKQRGQTMRRCVLRVYATREEFDHHEGETSPSVKGFFVPLENRVSTYDPRTEPSPRPLTTLWSTLFHEASHQFTRAISTELIPAWLNEGTASYFEGAFLLPSGFVQTNQIPESRLKNLLALLKRGQPTVKDVVSYFQPGSYPGEYYPFGWGLVYFIQNYENEQSERVYLPIYRDYLKSYKSGGKHDSFQRFVEYFVEQAEQPGITTFDEFVAHWRAWIEELGEIYYGGPEQADVLLARAEKQMANGQHAHAVESLRWAIQKRFGDPWATYRMGEALVELEASDGAMHSFRQVLSAARSQELDGGELAGFDQPAPAIAKDCLAKITKINRSVGEGIAEADADFVGAAVEAARGYVEAGYPRSALQLLASSSTVLGGDAQLAQLSGEIQTSAEVDLLRWRRPRVDPNLEVWEGGSMWSARDAGIAVDSAERGGLFTLVYRDDLPDSYRYEAVIEPGEAGEFPVFGLVFGANNQTGSRMFALLPSVDIVGIVALEDGPEITERFGGMPDIPSDGLPIAIEITPERQVFYLNGKKVGERKLHPTEIRGRIGLFAQQTAALYRDLRVRY